MLLGVMAKMAMLRVMGKMHMPRTRQGLAPHHARSCNTPRADIAHLGPLVGRADEPRV